MSLAHVVRATLADIDALVRLYRQLRGVPGDVVALFEDAFAGTCLRLRDLEALSQGRSVGVRTVQDVRVITVTRGKLLELELFVDPEQRLPRSGPGSRLEGAAVWSGKTGDEAAVVCNEWRARIRNVDGACQRLISALKSSTAELERASFAEPSRRDNSLPSNAAVAIPNNMHDFMASLIPPPPFANGHPPMLSAPPFPGASYATSVATSAASTYIPSQQTSPLSLPSSATSITATSYSPIASPAISFGIPVSHVPHFGLQGTGLPPPVVLPAGDTLVNLPAVTSSTLKRRKREKTLAEKKVQQMIEEQYSKSGAAGAKRKRANANEAHTFRDPFTLTPPGQPFAGRNTPPPIYPPSSPRLGPSAGPEVESPAFVLDDLHAALPLPIPSANKGKARATAEPPPAPGGPSAHASDAWETASSAHASNASSAASVRSSILSTASRDRAYEEGACAMHFAHPTSGAATRIPVTHIEVRAESRPTAGDGIALVVRDPAGREYVDRLWNAAAAANCAPFLAHSDIVAAMRPRRKADKGGAPGPSSAAGADVGAVVLFAPNPEHHPQYAFSSTADALDFVGAVAGAAGRRLACSADVESVKSGVTHGNSLEAGLATLQVWDDSAVGGARVVRLFRNRNEATPSQVVDVDCNCLRAPERDGKGKWVFGLRDVREGAVKELRYLKVAFSRDEDRNRFLREVGFGHFIPAGGKS